MSRGYLLLVLVTVQWAWSAPAAAVLSGEIKLYLDSSAIVVEAGDVARRQIPWQIRAADGTGILAESVYGACDGLASLPQQLLIYVPGTGACLPLTGLFAGKIVDVLGLGSYLGLKGDAASFMVQLESEPLLLLLPRPKLGVALACVCPQEVIYADGFEALLEILR